jgi:hypothetical protein
LRRTLLPERSKLCKSHWSNQWLTSNRELKSARRATPTGSGIAWMPSIP